MTVIAQDVFTIAMTLMDEESETGAFDGFPEEYKKKAWVLLTMLQSELLESAVAPLAVTSELNVLQLDDQTCLTVLPYGLAAHLLMNEDQSRASFFNSRYDELKRRIPSSIVAIKNVYVIDGTEQQQDETPITPDIDGGSFLDPDSGEYDGGEW